MMKYPIIILLFITMCASCKMVPTVEILALSEIINSESHDAVIWKNLIPLTLDENKNYQDYLRDVKIIKGEIERPPRTGNEVVPDAPSIMHNESVFIGSVLFRRLLMEDQLKEEYYNEICHFVVNNESVGRKLETGNVTDINIKDIWSGGTGIEKFREYGYPILVDNRLIVYSNTYTVDEYYSNGIGKFDIYDRINGHWTKTMSIIKWIS